MTSPQADPGRVSAPRRRVLDVLATAGEPLGADRVAEALGVHLTTARFHLDRLVEAGFVRAEPVADGRRGRPRLRYRLVDDRARDDRARDRLIGALAGALAADAGVAGGDTSGGPAELARLAGLRWAQELTGRAALAADQTDAAAAVARLDSVLTEIGFAPERDADGFALTACPFRDAARRDPSVVCSVHRGLIEGVWADAAGAGEPPTLLPFVAPERCLVRLPEPTDR
ncbi:helix-turn-helix domain-containing protein [Agromyces marinus]|uniref:Transcriptional regulator n=1 Tax=Agromyces marinus TaxID=1389020 RepID=A0ABN6YFC2_9MICO|nr:helix-turn-helix domain-containing protein [Agromyces marinus]UIP58962.1 hypothetical protein DSM26151_18530 [Agromyces marinus]BDZ56069.1 transcriptional regulator [Agromyces marinus]